MGKEVNQLKEQISGPMTVEQGVPRIENDLAKVARYMGETNPAQLTDQQIVSALSELGHDASIVIWECGKVEKP